MVKILIENSFRFIFLIIAQVFLFKNVAYYNLANPFPYILFILLLPLRTPKFILFLLAFICGLTIDVFYDTLGIHIAACVTLSWLRIIFIEITLQPEDHEPMATPGINEVTLRWFLIYILSLTFLHHLVLFFLEAFTFHYFFNTLISVIFSTIFTTIIIFLFELLFYQRKRR